ncbi:Protein kinase domain-containing protein [Mycena chlorophos]|uniref:Protein kinase domain-containing protein n=1 Tax=Mycena chlorophos TaxID=658473 RepID=A0A8H6SE02_MYCCL|nr:Protein kinase domain-containing protein [Mycena chlorophos]
MDQNSDDPLLLVGESNSSSRTRRGRPATPSSGSDDELGGYDVPEEPLNNPAARATTPTANPPPEGYGPNTPRIRRAFGRFTNAQVKQGPVDNKAVADANEMSFYGVLSLEEFFVEALPKPEHETEAKLDSIVAYAERERKAAKRKLDPYIAAFNETKKRDENVVAKPFVKLTNKILSSDEFPQGAGAMHDTHTRRIPSLDEERSATGPDLSLLQAGTDLVRLSWAGHDMVAEIKWLLDFIDSMTNQLRKTEEAKLASNQLSKSARYLLMQSGRCRVYLITLFALSKARLFCYDRAGWVATDVFDWLDPEYANVFPRFFYRLYAHKLVDDAGLIGESVPVAGCDDTISRPDEHVLEKLWSGVRLHEYLEKKLSKDEVDTQCIRLIAARRADPEDPHSAQELIHCLTVGPILSVSDSLVGRATRVYRVVIEEDLDEYLADGKPPVMYALKDVWRENVRREEIDYYDLILHHCKTNGIDMNALGMARCLGSIDLFEPGDLYDDDKWDNTLHRTRFGVSEHRQRHHTRTLLTPVGLDIEGFPSTKKLVGALHNATIHLGISFDAGVLHRDVSPGNVLLAEDPGSDVAGFLVDYDYAELTEEGVKKFNDAFPSRTPAVLEESKSSLKDFTGTFKFMAIQIVVAEKLSLSVRHELRHDLESVYWVLIWNVLRHVKHQHPDQKYACLREFPEVGTDAKRTFVMDEERNNPLVDKTTPLSPLLSELAILVRDQNLPQDLCKELRRDTFLDIFEAAAHSHTWPLAADPAEPYELVSANDPMLDGERARDSHQQARSQQRESQQRISAQRASASGSAKRGSAHLEDDAGTSSELQRREVVVEEAEEHEPCDL